MLSGTPEYRGSRKWQHRPSWLLPSQRAEKQPSTPEKQEPCDPLLKITLPGCVAQCSSHRASEGWGGDASCPAMSRGDLWMERASCWLCWQFGLIGCVPDHTIRSGFSPTPEYVMLDLALIHGLLC